MVIKKIFLEKNKKIFSKTLVSFYIMLIIAFEKLRITPKLLNRSLFIYISYVYIRHSCNITFVI